MLNYAHYNHVNNNEEFNFKKVTFIETSPFTPMRLINLLKYRHAYKDLVAISTVITNLDGVVTKFKTFDFLNNELLFDRIYSDSLKLGFVDSDTYTPSDIVNKVLQLSNYPEARINRKLVLKISYLLDYIFQLKDKILVLDWVFEHTPPETHELIINQLLLTNNQIIIATPQLHIFTAIRVAVKEGKISNNDVMLITKSLTHHQLTENGRFNEWPNNFDNINQELLVKLL